MSDELWEKAREIVADALELSGAARAEHLDQACGGDAALRAEVERLLAHEGTGDPDFLEPPPRAAADEPARHVLGEFELLREIGRGGMGVVYLARQPRLKREVAVKVLAASPATAERDIERFHREARATASLRHPGIVQVFADGQVDDTHWFAMEHVEGHDLHRELQLQKAEQVLESDRPFLPRPGEPEHAATIARLCRDVADALHHAHEHGLVHRDVKPQNLLLQPDGRVQIGDFGLVRDESQGSITRTGEVAGTPHYMSPEQAQVRQGKVDHRTDVYSLGVVLYELATLHRPFEGKTSADVITKIRDTDPRMLRAWNHHLPRDLQTICLKAMAKDPRARYATAAEMRDDLKRFLGHEAIHAKPPGLADRARRWVRRHRVAVGAVLLVALGLWVGSTVSASRARARTLGRVSVEARDASGSAVSGTVELRRIDPITGIAGPPERLGRLPIDREGVEPGYYRIVVDLGGAGRRVFPRDVAAQDEVAVHALVSSRQEGHEGMVFVEGGTLRLRDERAPLVGINGRDLEIESFWLDATEVTVAQYREFLAATGWKRPLSWDLVGPEMDDRPVAAVSWRDACAYAEWAGKHLPSYAEWTWAARGAAGWIYPWGNDHEDVRGNVSHPFESVTFLEGLGLYLSWAAPVLSSPEARTPSGLYHMFGNVEEWTETWPLMRTDSGLSPVPTHRIAAGHAWDAAMQGSGQTLQTHALYGIEEAGVSYRTGFRCAE